MAKRKEHTLLYLGLGLIVFALFVGYMGELTGEELIYQLSGLTLIIGIVLAGVAGFLLKRETHSPVSPAHYVSPPAAAPFGARPFVTPGARATPPPLKPKQSTPPPIPARGTAGRAVAAATARTRAQPASSTVAHPVKIFISYRRKDTMDVAGRLYDRLVPVFGKDVVFKDVDSIPLGTVFSQVLLDSLARCDVVLVVIGRRWMGPKEASGKPRIWSEEDFVRQEVQTALRLKKHIIPVLVNNAPVPNPKRLPEEIREVLAYNGARVRQDPDFHQDMDKLIERIAALHPEAAPTAPAST